VGGDFYQIFPDGDGPGLLVIGDVSGKGLQAAMKGTLALGALRAFASEKPGPAALLGRLNRELCSMGSEGFITSLVAGLAPDGVLTLANAGHLAPYRNGEEIAVEPGLPLGVTADSQYAERTVKLSPGDSLTFLSDGVVEAQNASGELFGFDRTQQISQLPADLIAEAAHSFGQRDDITVLTLRYAPAGARRG
jgi:phosphoserine phosphatase RsbU/P